MPCNFDHKIKKKRVLPAMLQRAKVTQETLHTAVNIQEESCE